MPGLSLAEREREKNRGGTKKNKIIKAVHRIEPGSTDT